MLDQATLEMTKGVDVADVRQRFRALFRALHPILAPENFDQLERKDIHILTHNLHYLIQSKMQDAFHPLASALQDLDLFLKSDYDEDLVKPLIKAALVDRSDDNDTIFWTSLFELARLPRREPSPPSSVASSTAIHTPEKCHTPPRYSSASQRGKEQTKKDLYDVLFRELEFYVHRSVAGFDEKYFQNKEWSSRAQDVFEAIKPQHVDGQWANLGARNSQDTVLQWLFEMQDRLLSEEDCRYYTINLPSQLTRGDTRRQIDVILKRKEGASLDTQHDWKDIRVIGELKASTSEGIKQPFLQLARYARDVLASQPMRLHLHAFTLYGSQMESYVFDRSGCYGPGSFDIHKYPERFIRTLTGYIMMSEDDLGLDAFLQKDPNDSTTFITMEAPGGGMAKFWLDLKPMTQQKAIVSRATTVFRAKTSLSSSYNCVAKCSWPQAKLQSESELLLLANERGVKGVPRLLGTYDISTIAELRSGLEFGNRYTFTPGGGSGESTKRKSDASNPFRAKRSRSESVDGAILQASPAATREKFNRRIFRCVVSYPAGRLINEYESQLELLTALRDAIRAHRSLFTKGNILHRDISANNIIIVDPKTNDSSFCGMLIDLDLAHEVNSIPTGAPSRTGTMEFMAIGVLRNEKHTYRHDLESFFYVLLWQCIYADVHREKGQEQQLGQKKTDKDTGGQEKAVKNPLQDWYRGSFDQVCSIKVKRMTWFQSETLPLFSEEFDNLKPLCLTLWRLLFKKKWGYGTPERPSELYSPILAAFDKAISKIGPA